MKRSRYSEEQIAFALRQAESGTPVTEVCRKMGVTEQSFYRWKRKYAGMGVAELRRLKLLEDENRRLKQLVADLALDNEMLQDAYEKSSDACPEARRCQLPVWQLPGERTSCHRTMRTNDAGQRPIGVEIHQAARDLQANAGSLILL